MKLLHNIGVSPSSDPRISSNYNTREEILACKEPLSFDGIYRNVWENQDVLMGKDVTLFVMGAFINGDNKFDAGMPYERYCNLVQLAALEAMGCKFGWHTWSHRDLTKLSDEEIMFELTPPRFMKFSSLAYPYGRYDDRVKRIAQELGYEEAFSVTQGDGSQYAKVRTYLNK